MRPGYPLDQRRIADLPVAVGPASRVPASGPAAPALVAVPAGPDGMVLRVYSRVGARLDGTCPFGL
jgi:hypothetical protein